MKITVKVNAQRAQYIAALLDLWEVSADDDPYDALETSYAIRLLPALIMDIVVSLNFIPGFWENLSDLADQHGWKDEELAWLLRLKDDNAMSREAADTVIRAYENARYGHHAGAFGFQPAETP